jgi:hypothetical protein
MDFFRCGSVPPCETYLFFYRSEDFFTWRILRCASASLGGLFLAAPCPTRRANSDLTKSASDLGFAAFFTRAQLPMWPFWRQKIGSCNQKTGPVETVGLGQTRALRTGLDNGPPEKSRGPVEPWERASITGLQKNRGPGEQGNPKKTSKQPAGT